MADRVTQDFLACYNDEILNWLPDMNDDDKANFLYHLSKYGKEEHDGNIKFSDLENGEYMPHLVSEKEYHYKGMKTFFAYDGIFLSLTGINVINFQNYIDAMSKHQLEPMKQLILSALYVLPPAAVLTCTFMILDHWYHYSLCNDTIETYQRQLQSKTRKYTQSR